jgi:hypothetical protein
VRPRRPGRRWQLAEEYRRQRDIVLPRFKGGQMEQYIEIMDRQIGDPARTLDSSGEFELVDTLGPLGSPPTPSSAPSSRSGWATGSSLSSGASPPAWTRSRRRGCRFRT